MRLARFAAIAIILMLTATLFACNNTSYTDAIPTPKPKSEQALETRRADLQSRLTGALAAITRGENITAMHTAAGFLNLTIAEEFPEEAATMRKKAKAHFDAAIKSDPTAVNPLLGRFLLENRIDVDDCADLIKTINNRTDYKIEWHPNHPGNSINGLYDLYARISGCRPCRERALQINNLNLARNPNDQRAHINAGMQLMHLGALDAAQVHAEKALELAQNPDLQFYPHEAYNLLGLIYNKRKQFDKAEEMMKLAIKGPDGTDWACAYQSLGGLYREMGKPTDRALAAIKEADLYTDSPDSNYKAALRCFEIGDFNNAEKYLGIARSLRHDDQVDLLQGFLELLQNDHEKAKQRFESLAKQPQLKLGADVGLGHLAVAQKQYDRAIKLIEPAVKSEDNQIWLIREMARLGLGWTYANRGMHKEALFQFERILQSAPNHILALLGKGNALIGLQKMAEAKKAFETVLSLQPENQYALAELGIVQIWEGNDDKAKENLNKALARDNQKYTCPYEGLGLLYMKQGDLKKAEDNFSRAIEINPDIEYKKYNGLAKIYTRQGKFEQARKLLRKSLENYPHNNEATDLLAELDANHPSEAPDQQ